MRLIRDIVSVLVITICWVILIDAGMHIAEADFNPSFMMHDSDRFIHLRPGAHGWWKGEGRSYVVINSYGFHDREHAVARPEDTLRIAVLGSSVVEADHVSYEQSLTSVIQRELENCPGLPWKHVEVFNFGVEGYGLAQQLITLRKDVWRFDPQIVIDVAALNNDIMNDDRRTKHNAGAFPFFLVQDGQLVPDEITKSQKPVDPKRLAESNKIKDMINESQIALMIEASMLRYQGPRALLDKHQEYYPPSDSGTTNAWAVSEAVWSQMKQESAQHGAEFWIVTPDMNEQVDPDVANREAFRKKLGVSDLYYADSRTANFAEQNGIPHITLAPTLADYTAKNHTYIHGFYNTAPNYGHWNALGNRLAGEIIAARLCKESQILHRQGPLETQTARSSGKGVSKATVVNWPALSQTDSRAQAFIAVSR
jgi:hypothetical protein